MSITRDFTLYLHAGISVPPVVHVNQYDQGEVWRFTLLDEDGTQYTPSTGALIGVKSDGHAIAGVTGTVLGDGRVSITETQQMTAAAGKAVFELTIDGGSHGTANFIVQVEPKPTDSAILSDSDLSIIQEGMNSVTPVVIAETVSDWLEDNLTNPPIDPTLSISNAAADAKVTGDKLTELKTAITNDEDEIGVLWQVKREIRENNIIKFLNANTVNSVTSSPLAPNRVKFSGTASASTVLKMSEPFDLDSTKTYTLIVFFGDSENRISRTSYLYYGASSQVKYNNANVGIANNVASGKACVTFQPDANYTNVSYGIWLASGDVANIEQYAFLVEGSYSLTDIFNDNPSFRNIIDKVDDLETDIDELSAETAQNATDVTGIKSDLDQITTRPPQLFDRNSITDGKYMMNTGEVYDNANYCYSPIIDVSAHNGETIYFSIDGNAPVIGGVSASYRFITAFDALGNVLSDKGSASGGMNIDTYTVPDGVKKIVITYYSPNYKNTAHFQAEYGQITPYSAYGVSVITPVTDVLNGKKWVACGDSFTEGDFQYSTEQYIFESGMYVGQKKVYPFIIGQRTGMIVINEAVSGSTMTHIEGRTNAFSDTRYQNIPSDADYITLKFGINDDASHQNVPIGTIDDTTKSTFYGAWNTVMNYLITNHLDAKIGIIITNGATLEIANATIAIAEKWGVPYLNEATGEQCSFVFRSNRTDIPEAIRNAKNQHWYVSTAQGQVNHHPNVKAHEYESTVIESWLRSL